jgi:heat shock protein HslJ
VPRAWRPLLAVGLVALLAGCLPLDLRSLGGTRWRAVKVVEFVPQPGRAPMMTFNGRGLEGSVGCETFQAREITIDPPRMKIDGLSVAGMPCADKQTQLLETAFFRALGRAEFIELEGGRLVLKGAEGAIMFERVLGPN